MPAQPIDIRSFRPARSRVLPDKAPKLETARIVPETDRYINNVYKQTKNCRQIVKAAAMRLGLVVCVFSWS